MVNKIVGFLMLSIILFASECAFHGSCYRDISGKIIIADSIKNIHHLKISLQGKGKPEYDWYALGTFPFLETDSSYFCNSSDSLPFGPQDNCDNNCGSNTLPFQIRITIIDSLNKENIADTVFDCFSFQFGGNNIVLPNIVLDSKP
jgi:hypothetical protein